MDSYLGGDPEAATTSPWGPDDEIGRLNMITPQRSAEVLARIDGSEAFDLAVTYEMGMPYWPVAGDPKYDIYMTHTPQGSVNEDLSGAGAQAHERHSYAGSAISMYSHTGTHLCSLSHIGLGGTFWNGWTAEKNLGSRAWNVGGVVPPIVARGILLDVATLHGLDCLGDSHAITAAELDRCCERQGVAPAEGDVVLVRTGRMTRFGDPKAFIETPPGLGMGAAKALIEEHGAMCVGLDVGGEVLPPEEPGTFLPVHAYLLSKAGAPVFENLWLEDLAAAEVWEFAFLAAPLKLAGSTGMPVRPLAYELRN